MNKPSEGLCGRYNVSVSKAAVAIFLIAAFVFYGCMHIHAGTLNERQQEEIIGHIDRITGSEEFIHAEKDGSILKYAGSLVEELVLRVRNLLNRLLGRVGNLQGNAAGNDGTSAEWVVYVLKTAGVLVIAISVFIIVYYASKSFKMGVRLKKDRDNQLLVLLKEPDEIERKAVEYYNKGDLQQALRFLYIALLIKLNQLDLIRIDKAKTNRQYLNELAAAGYPFIDIIQDFTRAFNEHWYGNKALSGDKFRSMYSKYNFLTKEVHV